MTPKQLYAMPPASIEKEIYVLKNHINVPFSWDDENNTRIELRYYADHSFDGERCFQLFSVWFNDKPVMICQAAGRGGRDHRDEFITNKKLYWEMLEYIRTLSDEEDYHNYHKEDEEISELDCFHGKNVIDFYNPELKPKYKIGDIVMAQVPSQHGYNATVITTKVKIKRIYPMNPTSTYWGEQTSRKYDYNTSKIINVKDGEGTQGAILNDSLIVKKIGEFDPTT